MNNDIPTPNSNYVKPCVKCGAQDRYNADGRCKPCHAERGRKWDKVNRDKSRAIKRKYREANPEKVAEGGRKWREANPGKRREHDRKYREANLEKERERSRKYREANPEKDKESKRKWAEANPENRKVRTHNRRARIKGNGGTLSKCIVQRLIRLQKGKCACGCNADLKQTGHHLDHIMPLALGGLNDDANAQLLTPACNLRKGAMHPDDWARGLGRLI